MWYVQYNGILFSNKKEQNSDTCYNTGKSQKYAKWKKPVMKDPYQMTPKPVTKGPYHMTPFT